MAGMIANMEKAASHELLEDPWIAKKHGQTLRYKVLPHS
jgi:hypothetical protein